MIATANTLPDVCFGSLADIAAALPNVRVTRADSTGQRNTF